MTVPSKAFLNNSTSIAAIASAMLAVMLLAVGVSRMIYPFDVGHYEACIWTPSLLSVQGHNPYEFAKQPPFVMAPYGYGYYLLAGVGMRLFGLQFWSGRALTILSAAICLFCVARIATDLTRNREAVWLAAFSFLSAITLHHWLGVHRPDLPVLALALMGLTLVFYLTGGTQYAQHGYGTGSGSDRVDSSGALYKKHPVATASVSVPALFTNVVWFDLAVMLAVMLLVGAFFFKQTVVLPAAIAVMRCWQMNRGKLAIFIAGAGLFFTLGAMLILNATSHGQYFWQHFTLMQQVPHSYATSWRWIFSLFKMPAVWITAGLIGTALLFEIQRIRRAENSPRRAEFKRVLKSPRSLIVLYFIGAAIFGFVTSARQGSYISYHLETLMAASIVVALAWDKLAAHFNHRFVYQALVMAFFIAGGFQLLRQARGEYLRWQGLPYYREVVATLRETMPPQSLGISVHPELMTAAGHEYHFGDWNQYEDGRSAQLHQVFRQAVESKRYAAIVWLRDDAAAEFPGYHLVPMKQPLPQGYYPVFVYVRD